MRKRPTPAERLLWSRLRKKQLGFIFHRQARMLGYIADFYCPRTLIVVEVDGSFHDGRQAYDAQRDRVLTDFGFRVMRFRNDEVIHDTERVIDVIRLACQAQC